MPPSPIMLSHRGGGGVALGGMGDVRLEFFSPGRVTQGVKAIPLYPLKHKGNGQSQTSSLGRPRSSANRSCTLLLYHESFAYSFGYCIRDFLWASGLLDLV
ncbi:hypothetical protein AVEN_30015-1 [Araneus ventricosus]|uniref:Uncharacterized protein n=1 Tax=Araneus ventricosus TaxID=182803 RepID=A0A4Y2DV56_ARAVE|nr:hypothetical protein AVEN_30015-1 [Araneus ventricosus]